MDVRFLVMLIVTVSIYACFSIQCFRKTVVKYDVKFIKRLYYCFVLCWLITFNMMFYDVIKTIQVFKVSSIASSQYAFNCCVVSLVIFIGFLLWEYIFISCKSIRFFMFNNVALKLESEEKEKINNIIYYARFVKREKNTLYAVLNAVFGVEEYIDKYIEDKKDLSPYVCYKKILKEYERQRKRVKLNVYYDNGEQMEQMRKDIGLNKQQLTSLVCVLKMYEFCAKDGFRNKDYMFVKIDTKYHPEKLIVVLRGKHLIDKEFLILFNLIRYFDIKQELEMLKL